MGLNEAMMAKIPMLTEISASFGALLSPLQISGTTMFDIVVAVVMIEHG